VLLEHLAYGRMFTRLVLIMKSIIFSLQKSAVVTHPSSLRLCYINLQTLFFLKLFYITCSSLTNDTFSAKARSAWRKCSFNDFGNTTMQQTYNNPYNIFNCILAQKLSLTCLNDLQASNSVELHFSVILSFSRSCQILGPINFPSVRLHL